MFRCGGEFWRGGGVGPGGGAGAGGGAGGGVGGGGGAAGGGRHALHTGGVGGGAPAPGAPARVRGPHQDHCRVGVGAVPAGWIICVLISLYYYLMVRSYRSL